jgi:S-adenosylmethionine:tRNA ribosyltransferase-isomerase
LKIADFHFDLPPELIAQQPLGDRAASRMLVVDRASGTRQDRTFRDLPAYLRPGDCLVLNDTRVMPSRIYARRAGGTGTVEVLFLRPLDEERREWQTLVRPGRRLHEGSIVEFDDTLGAVVSDTGERGERTLRLLGPGSLEDVMQRLGHMPLPPYIRRDDAAADRERYQTVFAREPGSAAAPTAGLHFTPEVLDACRAAGADIRYVTLHVGLGTFAPLRTDTVEQVRLHSERYRIGPEAARAIQRAERRICVGTTSVRTLETFARTGAHEGDTELFISPGFEFRLTNAMLTNFHLPESSLLILVSAFAGRELILDAYAHAVRERYRFFSYGDCMLIAS